MGKNRVQNTTSLVTILTNQFLCVRLLGFVFKIGFKN